MSDHHSRQSATGPGQWPYPPIAPRRRVWPWVLGTVAVLLFVLIGCSALFASAVSNIDTGATGPQSSTPSDGVVPTPAAAGPATVVGDGTYEVGTDLVAGKYKTPGSAADSIMGCSYHVKDSTLFGYSKGPGVVTVKAGQQLTLSGGCTWTKS